jgi:hypothetical protein
MNSEINWPSAGPDPAPDDPGLAWDAADRYAVALLARALPEVRSAWAPGSELHAAAELIRSSRRRWPYRQLARAAWGRGRPPADDAQLWLDTAGAFARAADQRKIHPQFYDSLAAVCPADWAGAVIGLARAGVGTQVTGQDLTRFARDCPETGPRREQPGDGTGEGAYDPFCGGGDAELLGRAFELVATCWQAVGALDEQQRLTLLGWWGLPRALARAWHGDLDAVAAHDDGPGADAEDDEAPCGTWPGLEPHPADLGIFSPPLPYGM